jgi:hypothetical protein
LTPKSLFVTSLVCLLLAGSSYAERRRTTSTPSASDDQTAAQPAAPPPTLAQLPATPPQVSFQGGQLTISAQNSTLGDILKAVRAQTGATIDLPGTAPERVVGHFGPGLPRDVLASLLNGSHFNYLLLGSPTDSAALDRVILMAKSGSSADSAPAAPVEQAAAPRMEYTRPMMPMAAPGGGGSNTVVVQGEDAPDDATDDSADATDDTQADDQADQTDQGDDQAGADDQQQPDGQQNVKTPEQLLQELQQQQQQLQQQQQQQGIQPGVPPGMRPFPGGATPVQPGSGDPVQPHN